MPVERITVKRGLPWKPSSEPTRIPQNYNPDDFTGSPSECVDSVHGHLKALCIYTMNNKNDSLNELKASQFPSQFAESISKGLNIDQRHYLYCVSKKQEHEKILATLVEQKRETRSSLEALDSIKQELQDAYTAALIGQDHKAVKGTEERIRESVQQREVLETRLNAIDKTEQYHQFEKGLWSTVAYTIKRAIAIQQANSMKAGYLTALETFKTHFIAIAAASSLDDSLNLKVWVKKELDDALASISADVNNKSAEIRADFERKLNQPA